MLNHLKRRKTGLGRGVLIQIAEMHRSRVTCLVKMQKRLLLITSFQKAGILLTGYREGRERQPKKFYAPEHPAG